MKRPSPANRPTYVVLQEISPGTWRVIGEIARRPGLTARAGRVQAIKDVTGAQGELTGTFAAIVRSEWRVAAEL